jgi:two-component system response regulator YesN
MIKVMIVDDEILVRLGLRSTIAWAEHGFAVAGDASSGQQAIDKFVAADPDILITDIRMPGMDGIELIRALKSRKPGLKTVILTNYDNFDYAKEALKLGADEYLLKTALDNQTLLPVLQKLREAIEREQEQNLKIEELQQQARTGLSYLKKFLAERLITGRIAAAEWSGFLKDLNLQWEGNLFQAVLLKGKPGRAALRPLADQMTGLISDIVERINAGLVWEAPAGLEWGVIYSFRPDEAAGYSKQIIPFNIRQIQTCLRQYFQLATLAIGGPVLDDYGQIGGAWKLLHQQADYRYFFPERDFLHHTDLPSDGPAYCHTSQLEKAFILAIRHGETEGSREALAALFTQVEEQASALLLRRVAQELYGELSKLAWENGIALTALFDPGEEEHCFLERCNRIAEIRDWFLAKAGILSRRLREIRLGTYSPAIKQAVSFIEGNYAQDIDLLSLARRVGLSKNHLCTLFREETGQNFVEYLHRVRIAHACRLLETTDSLISEIGLKVGFGDPKYFAKVFQKLQNCPPSEYRARYQ